MKLTATTSFESQIATAAAGNQITSIGDVSALAAYLVDGYWQYTSRDARAFDVSSDNVINVNVARLTPAGKELARAALDAWEDVTGLRFVETTYANAEITFDDDDSGAYSNSVISGSTILSSHVNVSTNWLRTSGTGFDSYSYQTYIHEIGHALGLGHAGPYNGDAVWGDDNQFDNDSWQTTVMSYFAQDENPNTDASYAYLITPMAADIIAMRDLYGSLATNVSPRAGNTTYGDNTNLGRGYDDPDVAYTVIDGGGTDTFNFSSATDDQVVNLQQRGVSSTYGLTGNIVIAPGTVIENALGGSGDDLLFGNGARNRLFGKGGDDTLNGQGNHDRLSGGSGADSLFGKAGKDVLLGNDGRDNLVGGTGNDSLLGGTGSDTLRGNGGDDVFTGGGGNDRIYGGSGDDQANYAGKASRYTFTELSNGNVRVEDSLNKLGVDVLIDVETVKIGTTVFDIGDLL
ncbi:MAG: flagellar biosynthesis protein FlgM [Hyphomicrobiales bacterium]|nr:MAG: flagellar biosynthesis protein FlgM [Hyphomicrobiales bacterium]